MKRIILTISAGGILVYAESCKGSPIKVEYRPVENCRSQKRTCCENGTWSEWGKVCGEEGCWNGREYEAEPDTDTHTISPNVNYDAIKKGNSALYKQIDNSFLAKGVPYIGKTTFSRVVGDVSYRRSGCKCTSRGWRCTTTFDLNLLTQTINTAYGGTSDDKKTYTLRPCEGGQNGKFLIPYYFSKSVSAQKNPCLSGNRQMTPKDALNVCSNIVSGEYKCGVVCWSDLDYEHSGCLTRHCRCWVREFRVTNVTCNVKRYSVSKSAEDRGSWFGE